MVCLFFCLYPSLLREWSVGTGISDKTVKVILEIAVSKKVQITALHLAGTKLNAGVSADRRKVPQLRVTFFQIIDLAIEACKRGVEELDLTDSKIGRWHPS